LFASLLVRRNKKFGSADNSGSARGIGQGCAIQFAKAGATIAAIDLRGITETVELVKKEGVKAKGWELDATNEEAVSKAIDEVEEQLGPIGILVNCAGIVGSRPTLMENYKNFWRTMEVNTGAVWYTEKGSDELDNDLDVQGASVDEETRHGCRSQHCFTIGKFGSSWNAGVQC